MSFMLELTLPIKGPSSFIEVCKILSLLTQGASLSILVFMLLLTVFLGSVSPKL